MKVPGRHPNTNKKINLIVIVYNKINFKLKFANFSLYTTGISIEWVRLLYKNFIKFYKILINYKIVRKSLILIFHQQKGVLEFLLENKKINLFYN